MSNTTKYDEYWKAKFTPLEKSIKRHEDRISKILTKAMNEPKRTAVFWNRVRSSIHRENVAMGKIFAKWSKKQIPLAYRIFLKDQMKRVKNLKSISRKAKKSFTQLANATASRQIVAGLIADSISDYSAGLVSGNLRINRLTRLTQQALIDEALVDLSVAKAFESGALNINTILKRQGTLANSLVTQAKNGRWITIIDKNGKPRSYTARYYAEMVSRVKFHEAQAQSALVTAANYDTDLVRVSDHNTTTPICQEFEGKIFSISGKDKRFPLLTQTPPFHVNCLHYITATFIESLEAQGAVDKFSAFSLGKTEVHPTQKTFIPVSERAAA